MELVITLRKTVESREEGEAIYELVKRKLEERPDITIAGHVTNRFKVVEEPT
ncbi:hypothetical protein ES703_14998 [subsurface metagenome]